MSEHKVKLEQPEMPVVKVHPAKEERLVLVAKLVHLANPEKLESPVRMAILDSWDQPVNLDPKELREVKASRAHLVSKGHPESTESWEHRVNQAHLVLLVNLVCKVDVVQLEYLEPVVTWVNLASKVKLVFLDHQVR